MPFEWQDTISIDPGLRNPLSAHFYCVDNDDNVYVIAEHYERDKDIDYHAEKIKTIADSLNWHRSVGGKIDALIDSAASQRTLSSSKSVAELFCERGINVNCKVNKELFSGINCVKTYLSPKPPRIFIFKNCVNMIREFKSYWWGRGDNPLKVDDHAMDELRYYLMTRPRHKEIKKPKSAIQKHYDKLLKKISNSRQEGYYA